MRGKLVLSEDKCEATVDMGKELPWPGVMYGRIEHKEGSSGAAVDIVTSRCGQGAWVCAACRSWGREIR